MLKINQFYCPNLPFKIYKHIHKFANTSMDISDGLFLDMSKLINMQKVAYRIALAHSGMDQRPYFYSPETWGHGGGDFLFISKK